jgi:hypothetical protein
MARPTAARLAGSGARLSGGLDRGTIVVSGVVTVGLIMAVLDTTIVNVGLESCRATWGSAWAPSSGSRPVTCCRWRRSSRCRDG